MAPMLPRSELHSDRPAPLVWSLTQPDCDFLRDLAGPHEVTRAERDRRDSRVPAPAIFFAQRCEIHFRRSFLPGVRADGHLCTRGRGTDTHRIKSVGIQKIWDELVVALEVEI